MMMNYEYFSFFKEFLTIFILLNLITHKNMQIFKGGVRARAKRSTMSKKIW